MQRTVSSTVHVSAEKVIEALADLTTYPNWIGLVDSVVFDDSVADEHAFFITLQAKVGPLSRSKRLRMVRTELSDAHVRFDRREVDTRNHADWHLLATVNPTDISNAKTESSNVLSRVMKRPARGSASGNDGVTEACDVSVELSYSGDFFSAPIASVLERFMALAPKRFEKWLQSQQ